MKWNKPDFKERIAAYERIFDLLDDYAQEVYGASGIEQARASFFDRISISKIMDRLERNAYIKVFELFFRDWLVLDHRPGKGQPTLAERFSKQHGSHLNDQQRQALRFMQASFAAPYRILGIYDGFLRLEGMVMPGNIYTVRAAIPSVMPGDVVVTRLLQLDRDWLMVQPWLLMMTSRDQDIVRDIADACREHDVKKREMQVFCKEYTNAFMQIITRNLLEIERDMVNMIEKLDFKPEWFQASVSNPASLADQLSASLMRINANETRYLLMSGEACAPYTWAYLMIDGNVLFVCLPPKEDPAAAFEGIQAAAAPAVLDFQSFAGDRERVEQLNRELVRDLADYLDQHASITETVLIPKKRRPESAIEQTRADFFARLSLQVGKFGSH
ncbi:MAG: hypothetical protein ACM3QZ_05860 [Solirubrobacterales bacterium]